MRKFYKTVAFVTLASIYCAASTEEFPREELKKRTSYKNLKEVRKIKNSEKPLKDRQFLGSFNEDIKTPGQATAALYQELESVSFNVFMELSDADIQKVQKVIVPLEQSYFKWDDDGILPSMPFLSKQKSFNKKLRQNQNITVVLECGDATRIRNNCLTECKFKKLKINGQNITNIGDNFLSRCTDLISLDLTSLSNVTSIGRQFLYDCRSLTTLDLTPLSNVTHIEGGFLHCCTGLTALDLTPLSNLTSIRGAFLSVCSGLTALDLRPLRNVRSIEGEFLRSCTGLRTLDLSPLRNITRIGSLFLSECTGLRTLDLSPLRNVTRIEWGFLSRCTGLRALDLRPLRNVTHIGYDFLKDCTALRQVNVPQNIVFRNILPEWVVPVAPAAQQENERQKRILISEKLLQDLKKTLADKGIDPKREGSDYSAIEYGMAATLLQGATGYRDSHGNELQDMYLHALEQLFSTERAIKLLMDITDIEDNSSDREISLTASAHTAEPTDLKPE